MKNTNTTNTSEVTHANKSVFNSYEEHSKAVAIWKKISNEKKANIENHVIYCILFNKSIDKAFTPITNQNKIVSNANDPHFALRIALRRVSECKASAFEPWQSFYKENIERHKYAKDCYVQDNGDEFIMSIARKAKDILDSL